MRTPKTLLLVILVCSGVGVAATPAQAPSVYTRAYSLHRPGDPYPYMVMDLDSYIPGSFIQVGTTFFGSGFSGPRPPFSFQGFFIEVDYSTEGSIIFAGSDSYYPALFLTLGPGKSQIIGAFLLNPQELFPLIGMLVPEYPD